MAHDGGGSQSGLKCAFIMKFYVRTKMSGDALTMSCVSCVELLIVARIRSDSDPG